MKYVVFMKLHKSRQKKLKNIHFETDVLSNKRPETTPPSMYGAFQKKAIGNFH